MHFFEFCCIYNNQYGQKKMGRGDERIKLNAVMYGRGSLGYNKLHTHKDNNTNSPVKVQDS